LKADLQDIFREQNLSVRIKIVDAGAAQFEGQHNRLIALAEKYGGEVYCFEPNPEQYERLKESVADSPGVHVLPHAIGDGKEHELKICRHPGGSSLLEPNIEVSGRYQAFGEWLEVVRRIKLRTVALDKVAEIENSEFLKLDIQGAELSALQSGARLLSMLLVVECEVNFVQQYVDQPLFSEIELFLRHHGFMFHKFCGFGSRQLEPPFRDGDPLDPGNQWLWSDAVFVRNLAHWTDLTDDQLIKIAVFMHELYGSDDFAFQALSIVDRRNNTRLAEHFAGLIRSRGS
jgi:FkbM family methyltransferase